MSVLFNLLWRLGITEVVRRVWGSQGRFVLEYHGVIPERWQQLSRKLLPELSIAELENALRWVAARYAFLSPEEFLAGEKPGVLLTFDDGLANNVYHALPLLERFSAPAVFFVATQHVAEPKDWLPAGKRRAAVLAQYVDEDQASQLFNGMSPEQVTYCAQHPLLTIGAHTVSHPYLTGCDDQILRDELSHSRDYLQALSESPIELFAYPAGDYDARVLAAVKAAGYRAAFVEDSKQVGDFCYEIPRIGIYAADPPYLSLKMSGWHKRPLPLQESC